MRRSKLGLDDLRGGEPPKDSAKPTFSFRIKPEVRAYIEAAAKRPGKDMTGIINYALEFDRDFGAALVGENDRIKAFAEANDLLTYSDLPKILALLVRMGLDAAEVKNRRKP